MRSVSVRELQRSIKQCVQYSQKDRIVITQHGEPSAVIIGVKGLGLGIGGHGDQRAVLEDDPQAPESTDDILGRSTIAPLGGSPKKWERLKEVEDCAFTFPI